MSRVEDDRTERRLEEARLADRRAQDLQKKERTDQTSAFDRKLAERSNEKAAPKELRETTDRPKGGAVTDPKAPEPRVMREVPRQPAKAPDPTAANDLSDLAAQTNSESERATTERQTERRAPQAKPGQPSASKNPLAASRTDARSPGDLKDAQSSDQGLGAKGEEGGKGTGGVGGKKGGAVRRASDDDAGGSGSRDSGGGSKDQPAGTPFRLPPAALMAPPPLARPKDAGGAHSAFTKEIVDKIVSRVLVGTNSQGASEFRIELRSNVLKGLTIRVSGGRGKKIRAVFSGSDREVLAALKKSSSELVDALSARGLTLENLEFEEVQGR
ncbi:MAG: flagellar hook-length control protein FliK [Deltaproteobacteria bacterium]|nr:flagellar hook-length control protein FliK [Deltaproteobacteria bacterium]